MDGFKYRFELDVVVLFHCDQLAGKLSVNVKFAKRFVCTLAHLRERVEERETGLT